VKRIFWKCVGLVLAALALFQVVGGAVVATVALRQMREYLPEGTRFDRAAWSWPIGLRIAGLTVPDPAKKFPFFLQVREMVLQVPVWGLLARPLPVRATLERPHLKVGSENIDFLIGQTERQPEDWMLIPFMGLEEEEKEKEGVPQEEPFFRRLPFIPFGVHIREGRVDVIEEEIRTGQPVFVTDHVNLSLALRGVGAEPVIELKGGGDFVTQEGKKIGFHSVEIRCMPRTRSMEGTMRLRYEQMGDMRNLYQQAPRPVLIEGGIADFSMQFALKDGRHAKLTASCLVQNLDLSGLAGDGVPWADIMHAVEDEDRVYQWTVTTEGDLTDPRFNPHDYVLSEVEWRMKEKAASRGLKIPGPMFFYADTEGEE